MSPERTARAVLALALLVALSQLALVHTHGLSRWRLGGFGMYSDYHPDHLQIWLTSADDAARITLATPLDPACDPDLAERCARWANAACLATLHACLIDAPPDARLTLWRPRIDAATGQLSREAVARWPAP
jgi:hypothetical protein